MAQITQQDASAKDGVQQDALKRAVLDAQQACSDRHSFIQQQIVAATEVRTSSLSPVLLGHSCTTETCAAGVFSHFESQQGSSLFLPLADHSRQRL